MRPVKSHIRSLDYLRIIAAFSVVFYHFLFRGNLGDNLQKTHFQIDAFKYGYLGVDIFFILSGFVIIFSAENKTWSEFLKRRAVRLYPTYWLGILFTTLILWLFGVKFVPIQFIGNLTMFQDILGVRSIDGVYWSLLVEVKFYLIIALVLYLKRFSIVSFCYIWCFSSALINVYVGESTIIDVLSKILITKWSSLFIYGIMCFKVDSLKPQINHITLLLISLSYSVFMAVQRSTGLSEYYNIDISGFVVGVIIALFCLLFLVLICLDPFPESRLINSLAGMTYAIYLIHQNVGYKLIDFSTKYLNKYLGLTLVVVLIMICSFCLNALGTIGTRGLKKILLDDK